MLSKSFSVLREEMRSEHRALIAAIEAMRSALVQRIDRLDADARSRRALLEVDLRDLKVSVRQNTIEIRELAGSRDAALVRLEDRVSALERRLS